MTEVNAAHPLLSEREAQLLHRLQQKRTQNMNQGRGREAHAMAMASMICWRWMLELDVLDRPIPDTTNGELDVTL